MGTKLLSEPADYPTSYLREQIENAIQELSPLFKVTDEEYSKFDKNFCIARRLPSEWPLKFNLVAHYNPYFNYFFFPRFFAKTEFSHMTFAKKTIYHESGHYIYEQLNKFWINGIVYYPKKNDNSYRNLIEVVAEYGNFILDNSSEYSKKFSNGFDIFQKYGKDFLPKLARMSYKEAKDFGIVDLLVN